MAYLQGLAGMGSGMMQGLELSRRHRFQDEEQQRAQRNEDRQSEMFGLQTDQMRSNMAFNEQHRPLQLQQAQGNLDHQEAMRPLQLGQAQEGLKSSRFQNQQAQQQAAMQDWQSSGRIALMAAEQGDLNAINSWLSNSPGQERAAFMQGEDGSLNLMLDMGDDNELMERPVSMEELPMIIRTMAGMAAPERDKGMNINGQLVNPYTGEGMGDFRDDDKKFGSAGGQGSGMSGVDRQRYFDQARKSINDVLRTHVGEQFMGDPEARDIQALAQGATYQVLDDLIRSGHIGNASPEVLGNAAISLAFSGEYPGLRMSEAEGMAKAELSKDRGRFSGAPSQEKVQALAKQIQQEAAQTYQNDIAGMVMAQQPAMGGPQAQQQGMPAPGGQTQSGQPPMDQQTGLPSTIARSPEQAPQQVQSMPGPQQQRAEIDLQDYLQGGLLREDQIKNSPGARLGRHIRDEGGAQIDRLRNFGSQTTVGLALQGMPGVRDKLDTVNNAFRHNVAGQIDGFKGFADGLADMFSPGINPNDVPPAVQNFMQAVESGQRPAPADIQGIVQFAEQHPNALTDQGLAILMHLAEEEGL